MYTEGVDSTVTHNGKTLFVDSLIALCKDKEVHRVDINDVSWILNFTTVQEERLNCDTKYPLICVEDSDTLIVLDGAHRLTKLLNASAPYVKCYILSEDEL